MAQTGFKGTNNQMFNQTMKEQMFIGTKQNNFLQTNVTGVNNYPSYDPNSGKKPIAQTSQGFYVPK